MINEHFDNLKKLKNKYFIGVFIRATKITGAIFSILLF